MFRILGNNEKMPRFCITPPDPLQPELYNLTTSLALILLLFPPPVPDDPRPITLLEVGQGGGEGFGKARVVETDAETEYFG